MPTYRYECANAECATGGEFTVFQSMSAEALKLCPTCGKVVERLIGPAYVSTPKGNTDLKSMGFASYFLIVMDFIKHGRSIGVPVGPGRGSGAGALVAYTLDITRVDPLPNGLLFERFPRSR